MQETWHPKWQCPGHWLLRSSYGLFYSLRIPLLRSHDKRLFYYIISNSESFMCYGTPSVLKVASEWVHVKNGITELSLWFRHRVTQ